MKGTVVPLGIVKKGECVAALKEVPSGSQERKATRHFKNHIPRLAWAMSMVPVAAKPDAALLDIGSKLDILEILRTKHG